MARKSRKQQHDVAPDFRCGGDAKTQYAVGAYIRLSVLDKKQKGDSIETQRAIIGSFIAEHTDMELRETYIDNGLSGQSFERPAFQRMIADMEIGKINCCIVKDLSRLGRNAIDSGYYIEKYFPVNNVRFVAITDNYDSADGQSGGVMVSLKNMINEAYALDISRKVRATVQMNINSGCFVGGTAPYGYLKSRDDCHKLVPDEYAAQIVRHIFEMAAEGHRANAILEWLNENEILTPKHYWHSIGLATEKEVGAHTHWSFRAVRDILSNRIYCGDMVQGKRRTAGSVVKKLSESGWVITENTHEAIISRELFAAVQELWKKPDKLTEPYYKAPRTANLFSRKVFCGDCGFVMIRKRGGENYYGFKCNTKNLYSKHACGGMYITEKSLKEKLFDILRGHESFLAHALAQTVDTAPTNDAYKEGLAAVRSELDKNQRFLKGLYESLVLGDITDSEYKEMKASYQAKVLSLTEREKQLRDDAHRLVRQESALSNAHESVQTVSQVSELTAEVIDRLVEKIHVYGDGRIAVKFRFLDEEA